MSMRPKKRDDWSQRRGGPRVPRDVAARPETSARRGSDVRRQEERIECPKPSVKFTPLARTSESNRIGDGANKCEICF